MKTIRIHAKTTATLLLKGAALFIDLRCAPDEQAARPIALVLLFLPHMLTRGVLGTLLSICACGVVFGQGTTSRIVGAVQDATGSLVPGATVKLINEGTRVTFTTTTSSAGAYVFEAVQPGFYEVDVEAPGFRTFA